MSNRPEENSEIEEAADGNRVGVDLLVRRQEVHYFAPHPKGSFPYELEDLINKHSIENGSDTPDFILAEYLKLCLENFDMCVRRREQWHGRR